jgi:hypothetical protein
LLAFYGKRFRPAFHIVHGTGLEPTSAAESIWAIAVITFDQPFVNIVGLSLAKLLREHVMLQGVRLLREDIHVAGLLHETHIF